LISVVSNINGIAVFLGMSSFVATVLLFITKYDKIFGKEKTVNEFGSSYTNTPEQIKGDRFAFKTVVGIFIISSIVAVVTPSQDTMNKMLIANTLTKQNISAGANFTQDQVSKIIDKIADAAVKVKEAK
jgi:hypothetical protein